MKRPLFLLLICALGALGSCRPFPDPSSAGEAKMVNTYLLDLMEEVYLWEKQIPKGLDPEADPDPFNFFETLCYRKADSYSFLTDDVEGYLESRTGVETSFGYSLAYGRIINTSNYFAVVQYVYQDSPAAEAGLRRGDIIIKINDTPIDANNASLLTDSDHLTLTMAKLSNGTLYTAGTKDVWARKQAFNPVVEYKVFHTGDMKVGYLCYTDFFAGSDAQLDEALAYFKEVGITDLVLDLRYNLGGYVNVAKHLMSSLAPRRCLNGRTLMFSQQWNDEYMNYWERHEPERIYEYFDRKEDVPYNLDLDRIFILTGTNTASASELVICGLDPYMEVVTIGEVTRGKCLASSMFNPTELKWKSISHWGASVIIYKWANANGFTDFTNGLTPQYPAQDVLMEGVLPLGHPADPMLATAFDLIGFHTHSHGALAPKGPSPENTLEVTFNTTFAPRASALRDQLIDTNFNPQ